MTEEVWTTSDDPWQLVPITVAQNDARKLLLFEVACCRRVLHLTDEECHRNAVVAAERFADGLITEVEFGKGLEGVVRLWREVPPSTTRWKPQHFLSRATRELGGIGVDVASFTARAVACQFATDIARRVEHDSTEVAIQVRMLRDIFGNPFRPVAFDPAWRTSDAVALARSMYDSRDFSAMPILADALQDAGCEDEQVLNHCRDANPIHVRGCWVCDLVLGKQ